MSRPGACRPVERAGGHPCVVSPARVRAIASEIARETGAHLFVAVTGEGAPKMDWHTVTIPVGMLYRPEAEVTATLLHEWGHRIVSPRSPERGVALAADLAAYGGVSLEVGHEIVNHATDLWVDDYFIRHPGWGEVYFQSLRQDLEDLRSIATTRSATPETDVLGKLIELMVHVVSKRAEAAGHGVLVDRPSALAERVLGYLFRSDLKEEQRLRLFFDDVSALVGRKQQRERLFEQLRELMSQVLPAMAHLQGLLEQADLDRLAAELRSLGGAGAAAGGPVADRMDGRRGDALRAKVRLLDLYPKVVRQVDEALEGRRQEHPEGWSTWSVGDPPPRLDVTATLERAGSVLPGVTTLQRGRQKADDIRAKGRAAHLCLVVDDSGSTAGAVNECEVLACLCLVETAERFGDVLSLVAFGSDVTTAIQRSDDYEALRNEICRLTGDAGGTSLQPALQRAARFLRGGSGSGNHVVILTDSAIRDMEESEAALRAMASWARVSFFCFEEEARLDAFLESVQDIEGVRVFASPVGDGFVEESLREVLPVERR